jgi:hypothetical protein
MIVDPRLRGPFARPLVGSLNRRASIAEDLCPECGGPLDTGWECLGCGFDAQPELLAAPELDRRPRGDGEAVN